MFKFDFASNVRCKGADSITLELVDDPDIHRIIMDRLYKETHNPFGKEQQVYRIKAKIPDENNINIIGYFIGGRDKVKTYSFIVSNYACELIIKTALYIMNVCDHERCVGFSFIGNPILKGIEE